MKKYITAIVWILIFGLSGYFTYKSGLALLNTDKITLKEMRELFIYIFFGGIALSAFVFSILLSHTTDTLNLYKRKLEKGSIDTSESTSRIKVLESKIKVLEKALDDALNK